jgi:hypothetical protein
MLDASTNRCDRPGMPMNGAETTVRPKFIDMLATQLFPGKPMIAVPVTGLAASAATQTPEDGKRRYRYMCDITTVRSITK